MITSDNLKEIIQTISPENIQAAINGTGDYILLEVHIFNAGSFGTIESKDYNETDETEASANGQLFCDKDTFLQMCEDLEIFEY